VSLLREVLADLWGMFVADARMTLGVLAAVAAAAALRGWSPGAAEAVLAGGVVAVLVLAVRSQRGQEPGPKRRGMPPDGR
jgi:hypothetical protein